MDKIQHSPQFYDAMSVIKITFKIRNLLYPTDFFVVDFFYILPFLPLRAEVIKYLINLVLIFQYFFMNSAGPQ